MAGLKELRTRIESIKSTQKITSAMKMVAASSLRKAQGLLTTSAAYKDNIEGIVGRIVSDMKQQEKNGRSVNWPLLVRGTSHSDKYLLLVFTSDRGLCGSFNASVAKVASNRIDELVSQGKQVSIACIGKKGYTILKRKYGDKIVRNIEGIAKKGARYDESSVISNYAFDDFFVGNVDICEVIYSKFRSAISRDIVCKQVLPVAIDNSEQPSLPTLVKGAEYDYEQTQRAVLKSILPLLYRASVYEAIINTQASEHGARMTSMDNATRNAKDMISHLTLKYNRMRQNNITTELTEIIAGAEAL